MATFDEDLEPRRPHAAVHSIGQDLYALSVEELAERVASLRAEIDRLEREIAAKSAQRNAADSFFRS